MNIDNLPGDKSEAKGPSFEMKDFVKVHPRKWEIFQEIGNKLMDSPLSDFWKVVDFLKNIFHLKLARNGSLFGSSLMNFHHLSVL